MCCGIREGRHRPKIFLMRFNGGISRGPPPTDCSPRSFRRSGHRALCRQLRPLFRRSWCSSSRGISTTSAKLWTWSVDIAPAQPSGFSTLPTRLASNPCKRSKLLQSSYLRQPNLRHLCVFNSRPIRMSRFPVTPSPALPKVLRATQRPRDLSHQYPNKKRPTDSRTDRSCSRDFDL